MLLARLGCRMFREDFGGYQLVERLGSGGTSTVYAARNGELRRRVAIKVLHPHLVGDGLGQRMLGEAHTLSLLDHPGIVKVLDMGVTADGRAYVVMELLAGEPLDARMRRERLTEARVIGFACQLASALEVAHGAGVVHRDLKPENVLVVPEPALPGGERVKLIDFGIAKREGQERTATGIVLGTPAYMAPEQFLGSGHVDPRADIYSLGVVIYQMATGALPFEGRDTGELRAEHAFCRPASASDVGGASPGLAAIIERCLAKRPEDRFATMGELGAALRALDEAAAPASPIDDAGPSRGDEFDEETATTTLGASSWMFGAQPLSSLIRIAPPPVPARRSVPAPQLAAAPRRAPSAPRLAFSEPPLVLPDLPLESPEPSSAPAVAPAVALAGALRAPSAPPRFGFERRAARWALAGIAAAAILLCYLLRPEQASEAAGGELSASAAVSRAVPASPARAVPASPARATPVRPASAAAPRARRAEPPRAPMPAAATRVR